MTVSITVVLCDYDSNYVPSCTEMKRNSTRVGLGLRVPHCKFLKPIMLKTRPGPTSPINPKPCTGSPIRL